MKKYTVLFLALILSVLPVRPAYAYNLDILSQAVILIEETSGKVLYEKNADVRLYPASLTKIMTVLVTLEHLKPEEYVVTGSEINEVPWDSSKAHHLKGETLQVENLIRGLIIPSGNETACVVAKAVAERVKGVTDMRYIEAEALFCQLMNDKAKELGATNTNFVNPHGYHNDSHYTTARDMVLITRAAMQNDLIRRIANEMEFIGNGAGPDADPAWKTKEYEWPTHNQMIIRGSEFFYSFATGIKTGFTDEAGYCFAVSAQKDERKLLAVTLNATIEDDRWFDARTLLEFGFNNFGDETILTADEIMKEVTIANPQLGAVDTLELKASDTVVHYLSGEEVDRLEREITMKPELLAPETADVTTPGGLLAPIAMGQPIAALTISLDGEPLYTGDLLAVADVEERTFQSDFQYYFEKFTDMAFSLKAVPFWIGGVVVLFLIIRVVVALRRRGQRRRNPYKFSRRNRW